MSDKPCKDCAREDELNGYARARQRPVVEGSGGRCATHWRTEKNRRKAANHERRVQQVYGLSEGEYERLYLFQGGRCALCLRATGATRRLSVDHDHRTGSVRGLLCRPCNTLLGHARDDLEFFERAIRYLGLTPYAAMKGTEE